MKKPQFVENQIYHIYNRGVDKRKVFLEEEDYFRFIHDLFEFNNEEMVTNALYYFNHQVMEAESQYITKERKPRKLLVEILIFTLMPNHFHLLLKQKREKGIVKFMHKLGTGYTNYFNKKYKRSGALFQGRFKAVLVNKNTYFIHLPFYIHTNPLDLFNCRDSTSIMEKVQFLENYKWSSFPDYIGKKNFPSVTSREFLLEFFGGPKEYRRATINWLKEREKNIEKIKEVKLD